jgi:hypothetical protein
MLTDSVPPSKDTNWIKKEDPIVCCLQEETHLIDRNKHWLIKGWKIYQANGP